MVTAVFMIQIQDQSISMGVTKPSVPTSTGWQMICTNMKLIPACGKWFFFCLFPVYCPVNFVCSEQEDGYLMRVQWFMST